MTAPTDGRDQPPDVALVGGSVLDVNTGRVLDRATIVVQQGRIVSVGDEGETAPHPGLGLIDVRGKWVIPGLIDMHAHVATRVPLPLELFLAHGVTTIRDPGGSVTELRLMRQAVDSGIRLGPRMFIAGNILDGNPPVASSSLLVDSPRRAVSAARFLIDQGVDCLKVYNNVSEEALVAIIETAREAGIPVIGHIPRSLRTSRAVELGMECLEHVRVTGRELLTEAEADRIDPLPLAVRETELWLRYDLRSDGIRRLINLLVDRGTFLDPTLTVDEAQFAFPWEARNDHPNNRYLPRAMREDWVNRPVPAIFQVPPGRANAALESYHKRVEFVRLCHEAGVTILAGTDGAGLGTLVPGLGLQHELALLRSAGLNPLAAIRAATVNAARALHRQTELGTIEPGKAADLVVLDGDPLATPENVERIHLVVKGGRILEPATLLSKALDGGSRDG